MTAPAGMEIRTTPDLSYSDLLVQVETAITSPNPWGAHPWVVFGSERPDSPLSRSISFWRRYADGLGPAGKTREKSLSRDGTLRQLGAEAMSSAADFRRVQQSRQFLRLYETVLLPRSDDQVDELLEGILATPGLVRSYPWHGRLAVLTAEAGCSLMVGGETERHESCVVFYGDPNSLQELRVLLDGFDVRLVDPPSAADPSG